MKKILDKKIAGFSLVEALIAALVVGVGLLGLAKLQGELFLNNSDSRMHTHAVNSAQEKIEDIRGDDYGSIVNGAFSDDVTGANASFTRTWTISDCPNTVNCKQILVDMTWTDTKNDPKQVRLTSYIGDTTPVNSGITLTRLTPTTTAAPTTTTTAPPTSTTAPPTTTTTAPPITTTTAPPTTTTSSTTTTLTPMPPMPNITNGTLTVPLPAVYTFQTLGGAFSCNGGSTFATIKTRYKVDGQYVSRNGSGDITFVNNPSSNTDFLANTSINVPLLSGQKVVVESVITNNGSCGITTQSSANNPNYVKTLFNGAEIPGYTPLNGQPTIKSFLGPYVSEDGQNISIASNQVIYLYEHYSATTGSTYDLQDNLVLITVN